MRQIERFTLGSSSTFRQRVLREAGYDFTVVHSHFDESAVKHSDPHKLARALAEAKAKALIENGRVRQGLLLTADQVVMCRGELRGKPINCKQAREFLESYNDYPAQTVSALHLVDVESGQVVTGVDIVTIQLGGLTAKAIDGIIEEGTVLQCAGGFAVEHPLMSGFVMKLDGSIDSVMGMPLDLLKVLLREVNPDISSHSY